MSQTKADVLLHATRIRIFVALFRRPMTPQQIAKVLPDIPQATLYRHINTLQKAGLLEVVQETPVRGTVEKVYAIVEEEASIATAETLRATPEDQLRYFTAFTGYLLSQLQLYLQQDKLDYKADGLSYRTAPVYLTQEEFEQMTKDMQEILTPLYGQEATPERRRRLLSVVIIPEPVEQ